jgi:hypothetical protein
MTATLHDFLAALFRHLPPGFIEVRVIEDRKRGPLVAREWYESTDALEQDLPRLRAIAEKSNAAIFFGVLPRRATGLGEAKDTIAGLVTWADLDFKDFPGGEAEARKRLAELPIPPTIIIRSGHGLHCYWLLREPAEPDLLSRLSRGIARAISADHTFDAARLLRLPETFNRKDPANPILVNVELLETSRVYNPSEIEDALNLVGCSGEPEPKNKTTDGPTIRILETIPPEIRTLLSTAPKIRDLFHGVGKDPVDRQGRRQDCSSSGYDASLLCALVKQGITAPDALATTLWNRPDGEARSKGLPYIERTVRRALGFMSDKEARSEPNVVVDHVRRFDQTPARYELTIEGKTLTLTTPALLSRSSFTVAFTDHFGRVPCLPEKADWHDWINGFLARAEVVPMPPEASENPAIRDAIGAIIDDLQDGEGLDGLDNDQSVLVPVGDHAGKQAFRLDAVLRRLKDDFPDVKRGDVGPHIRHLGFSDGQITIEGGRRRVWFRPAEYARGGNEQPS